jgi:mono/diheme cytochrome c family protein
VSNNWRTRALIGGLVLAGSILCGLTTSSGVRAAAIQQSAGQAAGSSEQAIVKQYCTGCHNQRLRTGGLALDTLAMTDVSADAHVWEKVIRKLRAGAMPPAGARRPDRATLEGLAAWLETSIDRAAETRPNPGRTETYHRLNRAEYQNAVRDLLALNVDVSSLLPADDASYGFDNIAGVLKVSPTQLERYMTASRQISRMALGSATVAPTAETFRLRSDLAQDDSFEGLPFGTRGGIAIPFTFPLDGEYIIKAELAQLLDAAGNHRPIPIFGDAHQLEIAIDGRRVQLVTVGEGNLADQRQGFYDLANVLTSWEVRALVTAGPRLVTVAFIRRTAARPETLREPFDRPHSEGDFTRYQPHLGSVTISGPFNPKAPDDTQSRRRILVCRPARPADEAGCARRIIASLARRAYRRPVGDDDLGPLLSFYREAHANGGFEAGLERALRAILISPNFLLRGAAEPPTAGSVYRISDVELASRLSFFLWSSIPDDELLDAAVRGQLKDPTLLAHQVRRMIADPRSKALSLNFAGQWLRLRNLPAQVPNERLFPDFGDSLRQDFRTETELFFDSILRENRSVLEFLTADYTFLNERLARHYDVPGVHGTGFRRVNVTNDSRRGLLGHGSILTTTSYPDRTSPVVRGKWILENLLGTAPPPPPANVNTDLKPTDPLGKVLSMRERMAQHRANPACAGCHALMDPLGLSLENFDAVGKWRNVDESQTAIDASAVLLDGAKFAGPSGLRNMLLDRSDQFVTTVTEKLLTYALGRGLEYYDYPAVRKAVHDAAKDRDSFGSILVAITKSVPFQMRRAEVKESAAASVPLPNRPTTANDIRRDRQEGGR